MNQTDKFHSQLQGMSRDQLDVLVKSLYAKLREREEDSSEPIAIVGAACRFPGAPTLQAYWELLKSGTDAITTIPSDRWDIESHYDPALDSPGKMYTKSGGFIHDPTRFDPQFFAISHREALSMDPQQRLLLEVAWESLENSGIPASRLRESRTGVFVGISTNDFLQLGSVHQNRDEMDAYYGTGSAASVAAGRISYVLGLQGPTLAVDTACSSSLVALHLAANALRSKECDAALVGGVNLMLSPDTTIYFCKVRALSISGRCKSFDADADGYVRGEGCGFVVLKRLSDAIAAGDRIMAVVRGTAVNHDGRTTGLTVPNVSSQINLLRSALANAGVDPGEVQYVEAHGTGTPLGDPIELSALQKVYQGSRIEGRPLLIGSAKSNIGHLEAAAGMAGVIKVALAMQHGQIPRSLHFDRPNPAFVWGNSELKVVTRALEWLGKERIATVSSFGFSGTNANVVMQSPDAFVDKCELRDSPLSSRRSHLVCLSAKTETALREQAEQISKLLRDPKVSLPDVATALIAEREQFSHRISFVASDKETSIAKLASVSSGDNTLQPRTGNEQSPKISFLFTGQGAQFPGMGKEIYDSSRVFRDAINQSEAIWLKNTSVPLKEVLFSPSCNLVHQTRFTQPAMFVFEYALGQLWKSWGLQPVAVMGHSVGEIAAACFAGLISFDNAFEFALERGRLMQSLPGNGAMFAVRISAENIRELMSPFPGVSVAADNGPRSVVVSGMESALTPFVNLLESRNFAVQRLQVSHAFHSEQIEPVLKELLGNSSFWQYSEPTAVVVSNVTGLPIDWKNVPSDYWAKHARQPVLFRKSIQSLIELGTNVFVEIGPQATLSAMGQQSADGEHLLWLPSLRQKTGEWLQLNETVSKLYCLGVDFDWRSFCDYEARTSIDLPNYPFQRTQIRPKVQERALTEVDTTASKATHKETHTSSRSESVANAASAPHTSAESLNCLFELDWIEQAQGVLESFTTGRRWLIVGTGRLSEALCQQLIERGDFASRIECDSLGSSLKQVDENELDQAMAQEIQKATDSFHGIDGVVFLAEDYQDSPFDKSRGFVRDLLQLSKALIASTKELEKRL